MFNPKSEVPRVVTMHLLYDKRNSNGYSHDSGVDLSNEISQ